MKKLLISAAMLVALAIPAHAETRLCTGRPTINIATGDGLNPKGTKEFSVGECAFENSLLQKRILRTCPMGSLCHVVGVMTGDSVMETITSVKRARPYQEGMRDYRQGLCFRARPYDFGSPEQKLWIRGYEAHPTKKQARRNDEICFPGREIDKKKH